MSYVVALKYEKGIPLEIRSMMISKPITTYGSPVLDKIKEIMKTGPFGEGLVYGGRVIKHGFLGLFPKLMELSIISDDFKLAEKFVEKIWNQGLVDSSTLKKVEEPSSNKPKHKLGLLDAF